MTKFPWLFSYLRIAPGPELSRKAWIQIGKSSDLAADRFRWTVQSDCSLGRPRPPVPVVSKISCEPRTSQSNRAQKGEVKV